MWATYTLLPPVARGVGEVIGGVGVKIASRRGGWRLAGGTVVGMPIPLLTLTGGNAAGLVAAALLLGYLVYALVRAERF